MNQTRNFYLADLPVCAARQQQGHDGSNRVSHSLKSLHILTSSYFPESPT